MIDLTSSSFIIKQATNVVKVLLSGLFFGVGVPVVYSLGLLFLHVARTRSGTQATLYRYLAGVLCLISAFIIVVGIAYVSRASIYHVSGVALFNYNPNA